MDGALEEEAPLLHDEAGSDRNHDRETRAQTTHSLSTVVFYFMAMHFLLAFCEMILVAPLIKLFEESLCLSHYDFPTGGVEESLCKIPQIQRPLATIRGWKAMFDTLPGIPTLSVITKNAYGVSVLLVAIPMGKLGDNYGRRKIMALALAGVAFSLSEIFTVCKSCPQSVLSRR